MTSTGQGWTRPMQRGASLLELGGTGGPVACGGCAQCSPSPWRYGSCANLDNSWGGTVGGWSAPFCMPPHTHSPPHDPRGHPHYLRHMPQTPQPYRRGKLFSIVLNLKYQINL